MHHFQFIKTLYREFIVYNLVFTIWAGYILVRYQEYSFPFLFWIKILGFGTLYFWYSQTRTSRFYFYYNLGFSKPQIIATAALIDFSSAFLVFTFLYAIT